MKTCLECGLNIVGREDKKYCDEGCRNAFNNKINKDSYNFMRKINNLLRRNYRILSELNSCGKSKTSRQLLLQKGFDFDHFTGMRLNKKGKAVYHLYDQSYLHLSNDNCRLIRKKT